MVRTAGVIVGCAVGIGTLGVPARATLWSGGGGAPESPSAVLAGDSASLALKVYGNNPAASAFLNSQGDVSVTRGPGFTTIGNSVPAYGAYTIQASWDEVLGTGTNTVRVVWKTSNAQPFVPVGAIVQGQPVGYLEWRLGVTNPVSFQPWVTQVNLMRAFLGVSSTGGATVTTHDITEGLPNPWNGTSFGVSLPFVNFINANYIEALFVYTPVPGPASLVGVGLGAGLLGARRRRSRSGV